MHDERSDDSLRVEADLFARARDSARKPAIVDGSCEWTYGDLAALTGATAARLKAAALAPGDPVVVFLDKSVESVAALQAVWTAGGIAVPAFEGLRSRQLRHIVEHSGARLLVSTPRKLAGLDAGSAGDAELVEVPRGAPRLSRRDVQAIEAESALPGGRTPAAILYTSGSTGAPKGILLSHANLRAGARIVSGYLGMNSDERVLSVLPFSFDYGLNQLLTTLRVGGTLYLQRSHFPPDICRALARRRITLLAAVPPLWIQLMDRLSPFPSMSFPHLRILTNSGGVLPHPLVLRYREHVPWARLFLMYGLSEAFRSTYLPPELITARPGSIGRAIPETQVFVLAADGHRVCADSEPGELVHRGPTVALGYWRDPEATAQRFRPDPFAPASRERVVFSGDVVRRDPDGFLYFVGRRDQLIKTQGYRVSPEEVESVIHDSGMVSAVVVGAVPDETAGSVLVAHVVPAQGFSENAFMAFCHREMPTYMVPKVVRMHRSLPCTASGKLDRKAVTDDASLASGALRLHGSTATV
ncbi:MAG TPA: AMP-binding protein [Planctomycetota bacterium]|nr:AMP-binding protein [Planctomycetota bacterium]